MKILYDYQIFDLHKIGGISRYFYELYENKPIDLETEISVQHSENEYIKNLPFILEKKYDFNHFLPYLSFRGKGKIFKLAKKLQPQKYINYDIVNKQYSIQKLQQGNFDVFHPTYFDTYFLEYIGNKPFVLTIHDMIYELYPEYFNLDVHTIKNKKILIEKAHHIIAISEQTKRDIIRFYDVNPKSISVIYHGTSFKNIQTKPDIKKENYILFTGSRSIYKNFYFLLESLVFIFKAFPNLKLICTGICFSKEELSFFEALGVSENIEHVYASDAKMVELYSYARAFIFPSLYEGFGLPILESFACNCPTLVSNASCFPEIAQDAALYFEPKNMTSIQEAVIKVLTDTTVANELIEKGKQRLADFSWQKCTKETYAVYMQVFQNL